MKDQKLKPCPFCGGTAKGLVQKLRSRPIFYAIICENCGNRTTFYQNPFKAIEKWNRRAKQ